MIPESTVLRKPLVVETSDANCPKQWIYKDLNSFNSCLSLHVSKNLHAIQGAAIPCKLISKYRNNYA